MKALARLLLGRHRYIRTATTYNRWRERRDPRYRESQRRLTSLHNRHLGQRCVIIGNGPSLRKTDLSLLEGEITFGLNRIYLLFDRLPGGTTYFVSVNPLVIEQCASEIEDLSCPSFISWACRDLLTFTSTMAFIESLDGPRFFTDVRHGLWEGATVTNAALQIAFHMGFEQVILIGVDHNFSTKGPANSEITSTGEDPNHFDRSYFGRGFRWQLPDLPTSELAYRISHFQYRRYGREVFDATVGGHLQVFPKRPLEEVLSKPMPPKA